MTRGSLLFALALFVVSIVLFVSTLAYPFKAKLFPLIALIAALLLLTVEIIQELLRHKKGVKRKEKGERLDSKHIVIWVWIAATAVILWVFGFMGTVILLPFLYLRFQRESWFLSISLSLGCGIFFYVLFSVFLKMPLYPGMILPRLLG